MYCKNCGARVDADANFCQRCGTAVRRDDDYAAQSRRNEESDRRGTGRDEAADGFGRRARRKVEDYVRDPERTQELLAMALSKAGSRRQTQGVFDDIWEYLQVASRLIQASVRGEYNGLSGKKLVMIVGALIYYVSPIDIIPDILPIAGLLDDAAVLGFALRSLKGEIDTFKEWERREGRGPAQ